jgi:hypothetical protein
MTIFGLKPMMRSDDREQVRFPRSRAKAAELEVFPVGSEGIMRQDSGQGYSLVSVLLIFTEKY